MTWIKLDDTFFTHPKNLELLEREPMAALLHIAGLCWCSHRLTDGRVPDSALHLIAAQSHTPPSLVDVLVETNLWTRHPDDRSWQIVNYLEWQESRAQVEAKRERDRLKKQRHRGSPSESPGDSPGDTSETPPSPEVRGQMAELTPAVTHLEVDDGFEAFWNEYPARDGKKLDKAKAHQHWRRLNRTKRELAMRAVVNYAQSGQRAKDAFRWLRDESFNDWQTPAEPDDQGSETAYR